jgi:hypothetical protein
MAMSYEYAEDAGLACIEPGTACQEPVPTMEPDLIEIQQVLLSQ